MSQTRYLLRQASRPNKSKIKVKEKTQEAFGSQEPHDGTEMDEDYSAGNFLHITVGYKGRTIYFFPDEFAFHLHHCSGIAAILVKVDVFPKYHGRIERWEPS